jgi:hypothetical protein
MRVTICTLFEGDYHFGLAALVNSLCANGYRGEIWAGYRGKLPEWVQSHQKGGDIEQLVVNESVKVNFVRLNTIMHFTHYKMIWMLKVFELAIDRDCLIYFDPDIVVKCRWDFFEDWVSRGVALCEDVNSYMPTTHPIRLAWKDFLAEQGMSTVSELNQYFNAGFVGLRREYSGFLKIWERFTNAAEKESGSLSSWRTLDRTHRFMSANQDTLNVAAMATNFPLVTVGPEGMGFQPGGYIMSHAIGRIKPWRKKMLASTLFKAMPPSPADKAFFRHVSHPIRLYSSFRFALKLIDLKCAIAIGRYVR